MERSCRFADLSFSCELNEVVANGADVDQGFEVLAMTGGLGALPGDRPANSQLYRGLRLAGSEAS